MRLNPRYPTTIECLVRTADGTELSGVIVDLSLGGAAVETGAGEALGAAFTLYAAHDRWPFEVSCESRRSQKVWNRRYSDAEFVGMDARARTNLERILGELKEGRQAVPEALPGELLTAEALRRLRKRGRRKAA